MISICYSFPSLSCLHIHTEVVLKCFAGFLCWGAAAVLRLLWMLWGNSPSTRVLPAPTSHRCQLPFHPNPAFITSVSEPDAEPAHIHEHCSTSACWRAFVKKKESGSKMRHLIVRTSVTFISRFPKSRSHSTLFCFIKRNFKLRSWSSHVTLAHFLFQQPITQTSAILSDPTVLPPNSLWVAAYYTAHGGEACLLFIGDWEKHVARRNSITLRPLI